MISMNGKSARVSCNASQATTTAANAIPFNVAFHDSAPPIVPFWDGGAPARLTAPVKGRYLVVGTAVMTSGGPVTTWHAGIGIVHHHHVAGSTPIAGDIDGGQHVTPAYKSLTLNAFAIVELDAGEWVELTQNADFKNAGAPVAGTIASMAKQSPTFSIALLEQL